MLPFIFWPWFAISCAVLMHRKVSTGSFRPGGSGEESPIPPSTAPPRAAPGAASTAAPTAEAPLRSGGLATASLAEALDGIVMPCHLAPLMGSGAMDPRRVSFFTEAVGAAEVGEAIADELERLGYTITPTDDRSISAVRDDAEITARLVSATLDSPAVMRERHPSAPADSLVVELALR